MKQVTFCFAALIVCGAPRVDAKTVAAASTPKRETIQSGDRAAALVARGGVDEGEFNRWLAHAPASYHHELTHMHPGDTFEAWISRTPSGQATLERIRIIRDNAGRKLAGRPAHPTLPSP